MRPSVILVSATHACKQKSFVNCRKHAARAFCRLPATVPGDTKDNGMGLRTEDFRREIETAMAGYEKYVVCLDKTPDEFQKTLKSLVSKAIKAYETRAAGLRHGIALDKQVTVILSENEDQPPLCGIYFNLHSPYQRQPAKPKSK